MKKLLILTTAAVLLGTGCVTKTGTGAVTGGALGALAGQAIGKDTKGTLIGAGVGAVLGGAPLRAAGGVRVPPETRIGMPCTGGLQWMHDFHVSRLASRHSLVQCSWLRGWR